MRPSADVLKATLALARAADAGAVRTMLAAVRPADWLMVAILLLLAWFEIWVAPIFQTGMPGPRLPLTLFSALAVLPLVARRAFPLKALIATCLGMLGVGVVGDADQSTFVLLLGLLVATYSVAAHAGPRRALIGAAVVVLVTVVFESLTFVEKTLVDVIVPALFLGGAWFVGKEVHRQRQWAAEAAEHSALLARTQRLEVCAAITAERTRIARELHDVVAHAVSAMGIQAGAARRTLASGQDAQKQALLHVERLGREALDEMQRMLGVLRTDDGDQGIGPLPDLTQVHALAVDARNAGLAVVLDMEGELDHLSPGVELTVYRIVQEALTNVRKHAQAGTVHVTITRYGDRLDVTVLDDGTGVTGEPEAGNGLIGMRERVAIHDGALYAGPGDRRGFRLQVQLPVKGEE
jgi:signal transduction histidine kinase